MKIQIADLKIEIANLYPNIERECRDYLCEGTCDFAVEIRPEDLEAEQAYSARERAFEGHPAVKYPASSLEITAVYREIAEKLPEYGGFVFHGSAVAVRDRVYVFAAKSGTGKTTHTRLWLNNVEDSFVVNGDKPIFRQRDGGFWIYGTPWAGKEGYQRNVGLPLEAVAILRRSEVNAIEPVTLGRAAPMLLQQCYRPKQPEAMSRTLRLIQELGETTRFYELRCNMTDEAAIVSYEGMRP